MPQGGRNASRWLYSLINDGSFSLISGDCYYSMIEAGSTKAP